MCDASTIIAIIDVILVIYVCIIIFNDIFIDAILPEIKYTKINITFLETFDVTFGKEEDCVTLSCKMTISPNLANLQPEAQWYRDGTKQKTFNTRPKTEFAHIQKFKYSWSNML